MNAKDLKNKQTKKLKQIQNLTKISGSNLQDAIENILCWASSIRHARGLALRLVYIPSETPQGRTEFSFVSSYWRNGEDDVEVSAAGLLIAQDRQAEGKHIEIQ